MSQLCQFNCFKAHFQAHKSWARVQDFEALAVFDFEGGGFNAGRRPSHAAPGPKRVGEAVRHRQPAPPGLQY